MIKTDNENHSVSTGKEDEKSAKIRKNIRLLAIFVALCYFVSAGMGWYEEQQKTAAQEPVSALLQSEKTLYDAIAKRLPVQSSLSSPNSVAISDEITLTVKNTNNDHIEAINITFVLNDIISTKTYNELLALIQTVEFGENPDEPVNIMKLLNLTDGALSKNIKDITIQSPTLVYELKKSVTDGRSLFNLIIKLR